jgi:hypothetical protein
MLGQGVVGVAAEEGVAIRIGRMTTEYSYNSAVRETAIEQGLPIPADTPVPYPGLPAPESQIAIPIRLSAQTVGVLFCESPDPDVFGYDEEDALALVAAQLGAVLAAQSEDDLTPSHRVLPTGPRPDAMIRLRHYAADNSVFVGNDYLIKGVAGAILWRMAQEHVATGRTEFTNRELRLDPSLRLPEYSENLEARLLLLQRRLAERGGPITLDRCGRGRLLFGVCGKLDLEDVVP